METTVFRSAACAGEPQRTLRAQRMVRKLCLIRRRSKVGASRRAAFQRLKPAAIRRPGNLRNLRAIAPNPRTAVPPARGRSLPLPPASPASRRCMATEPEAKLEIASQRLPEFAMRPCSRSCLSLFHPAREEGLDDVAVRHDFSMAAGNQVHRGECIEVALNHPLSGRGILARQLGR